MAKIRQLPELFLRGSLANETMKGLSAEEKAEVDEIVTMVLQAPELESHRIELMTQLSNTIGGDYRDDRYGTPAQNEYRIIVWKATVFLLYHSEYTYTCLNCTKDRYTNPAGKVIAFNRRYPKCPNCKTVAVTSKGCTQYLTDDLIPPDDGTHTITTPITSVRGERKIPNAREIIFDPLQRKKYYSEYVWGYFRQIIRENKITDNKQVGLMVGNTDEVLVAEIIEIARKYRLKYYYDGFLKEGRRKVTINCLASPPAFSVELLQIINKHLSKKPEIKFSPNEIDVKQSTSVSTTHVKSARPVSMISDTAKDDEQAQLDLFIDRTEDVREVESNDTLRSIRNALPDGGSQIMFDILSNQGKAWIDFSTTYGERPRNTNIAKFLGCSPRQVKLYEATIKAAMCSYSLTPASWSSEPE